MGTNTNRQEPFNFYLLKRAIKDRLSLYKSTNHLLIINSKK